MKRLSGIYWLAAIWMVVSMACSLVSPAPQEGIIPTSAPTDVETSGPLMPARELFGKIAFGSERGGTWQIIAMDANGAAETSLTGANTNYSRPSWSPDGHKIAMRSDMQESGIAVMDVQYEAGKPAGLPASLISSGFSDAPKWSPDGTRVLYSSAGEGGGWITYITDVAAGTTAQVTGIPENAIDPAWSPDGTQIVFAHYSDPADQIRDLYVINVDGSGLKQLTNTPGINEQLPAWSPDGSRIAFSAAPHSREQNVPGADIFVMDRDGGNVTQLTTDPHGDFDPAWSPDGKYIAFVSDRHDNFDSNYEIYVIGSDGTGEMRLTNNRFTDRWPSWRMEQPEDSAASACQPAIALVADVTIPPGTRFAGPESFSKVWRVKNAGTCAWTPDSYLLSYTDGEFMGGQIAPMPGAIQPGATVDLSIPLTAPSQPGKYQAAWQLLDRNGSPVPGVEGGPVKLSMEIEVIAPDQSAMDGPLYFISATNEPAQLWRVEPDGRTRKQITSEPQPVVFFDVSSDGSLAYFSGNQVIVTDAQGGNRTVVAGMQEKEGMPELAWSPDGKQLAYSRGGVVVHDFLAGTDRLLIPDNDTGLPGLERYAPRLWSPDGSKLLVNVYQWESAVLKVISSNDGAILSELPFEAAAWSNDSQSVYYASDFPGEWMSSQPGLWRTPAAGGTVETILSGPFIWWPRQAPDSSLYFFMYQPASEQDIDFMVELERLDLPAGSYQAVNTSPILVGAYNTFKVSWSADARSYAVQTVRRSMDVSEVLVYRVGDTAPLFLTQEETGQFLWGR